MSAGQICTASETEFGVVPRDLLQRAVSKVALAIGGIRRRIWRFSRTAFGIGTLKFSIALVALAERVPSSVEVLVSVLGDVHFFNLLLCILLLHFDDDLREVWISRYPNRCVQQVGVNIKKDIQGTLDSASCIVPVISALRMASFLA